MIKSTGSGRGGCYSGRGSGRRFIVMWDRKDLKVSMPRHRSPSPPRTCSRSGGCGDSPSPRACWGLRGREGRIRTNFEKKEKKTRFPLIQTYVCGWGGASGGTCPSRCKGGRWKAPADACCALCPSPPSLREWCKSEAGTFPSERNKNTERRNLRGIKSSRGL